MKVKVLCDLVDVCESEVEEGGEVVEDLVLLVFDVDEGGLVGEGFLVKVIAEEIIDELMMVSFGEVVQRVVEVLIAVLLHF